MIFTETRLQGTFEIDLEKASDERGFFARTWCAREFQDHGLPSSFVQANLSSNRKRGTLRGMHFQAAPHEEAKLMRCTRGAVYCVVLDLRPCLPTHLQWLSFELSQDNYKSLFVGKGMAVGFITLQDQTEVLYQMSEYFVPKAGRGYRYNDPAFAIHWPVPAEVVSDKDRSWPDYIPEHGSVLLSGERRR